MAKLTKWRKGKPPCAGWWNASVCRNAGSRRWWDGRAWSAVVFVGDPDSYAKSARMGGCWIHDPDIEWRGLAKRPENAAEPHEASGTK